jgi:hypothetical protein
MEGRETAQRLASSSEIFCQFVSYLLCTWLRRFRCLIGSIFVSHGRPVCLYNILLPSTTGSSGLQIDLIGVFDHFWYFSLLENVTKMLLLLYTRFKTSRNFLDIS